MKATVDALVQVALYSAAITAGILLFRFIFKNRISSKLQYLMWWLLILRLIIPVTPDIGIHLGLQSIPQEQAVQAELPTPAPVLDVAPASVPNTQPSYESVAPAVQPDTDVAPSQHVNPAKSTDWYSIVFVVWLLGAIGFLGWLIFVKLRYYESLQHLMAGGPREVYELYDRCCKELCVKPLPLWIVNKSMSPGIAFFGEPVLLVPLSLCNDESRLRFALLHELTHKKRGDHYMTLLLNILRAVYWFDPVVHFAFSELRADMESACDSDVLAYIGHEQKRGYLTVILDMFSYDTEPILGMSQIRSKRMAKRRMKGAFMKNRTSPAFRAITLCIALIMSLCCFTTACQSAPEKDTPGMAAEQTADPSPKPTLIPDPSAQEPEAAAATYAFDRTDPKQAVAEFLTRYLDDMAHGNDDFGFDSSNSTMYDGLLQLQGSFESHKNIALLRQWISFTQVLRETTVPAIDRGRFQSLEITEFGIVDQLSGGIMYEYLLKGYFKTTVMGTFIEAGLIKDGDKYVITYVDFPDSKEYKNFCADFIDYAERNDIKDYNKNAYIEYIRKQKQQAAEMYPIAAPESDPSSGLTSSAIADIQSALKALGYLENPSGTYDSATRAAIEMFQEDNALPTDGIAGDETLALLLSDSAKNWTLADGIYTGDKRIWREPPKDGVDGWSSITADKISAYSGSSVTSTGAECKLGTASVNPNAIPIGTELYIPGYGYAIAADVNAYKNKVNHLTKEPLNMIDLWFASKEDARKWENKHNFTILYRSADARPAREAPTADAIASTAKNQVGKEYVLNASGPDEFDCSGLVYYVLNECGIAVDRKDCAGYAQNADWGKIESLSDVKAGDILFFHSANSSDIQHAGIAVSSKNMIDASSSHGKVVKRSCNTDYWNRHFAFARRVVE
jgi:beta-lactamase regulating signal transducer with metallopeptidase domain/peptidoglycan hydrolase-like protein with peptidoglycan-binding domain